MRRTLVMEFLARHFVATTYAVSAAVRLAMLAGTGPISGADTAGYRAAAEALRASSLTDSSAFLNLPPLFPAFLAFMPNTAVAAISQSLIAAFVAPLLGLAARRCLGTFVGWSTALVAALEPNFVFWSTYLLTDNLGLFFLAAGIERTTAGFAESRVGPAIAAGAASGLAFLSRAATLAPSVVLACAHAITGRSRRARVLGLAGALGLIVGIAIMRNFVAAGEIMIYRDQGWQLVWSGTTWNEVGRGTAGVDITFPVGYETWSLTQRNEYFREASISFIRDHPVAYAGLMLKKALWFWIPFYPEWSDLHKLWAGAYFVVLYALAIAGAVRHWREPLVRLLVVLVAVTLVTIMVTIVDYDGRYRLPAELFLVPLAGAGIARLRDLAVPHFASARSSARI
jgi:hypothetical protein